MATDSIGTEALDKLFITLQSLMPLIIDPVLPASLQVVPGPVSSIGVGGVIGISQSPSGEIQGRRVEASVVVTAAAKDTNSLGTAVTNIARAFTSDPGALRASGIERLRLAGMGPAPAGGTATVQRELTFDIIYEYLKLPLADEGQIKEVPIDVQVN
jgi:hypothetical protein